MNDYWLLFVVIIDYAKEIDEESISAEKKAIDIEKRVFAVFPNRRTIFVVNAAGIQQ